MSPNLHMISSSPVVSPPSEEESRFEKMGAFRVQGRDKRGNKVLVILGKLFSGRDVNGGASLSKYLEEKVFPELDNDRPFSVLYVNTGVQRSDNFPGISGLKSFYDAVPAHVKIRLDAVYFLHPGLHSWLFLSTFGRIIFPGGVYGKLKYVNRVEFLWDHLRRKEMKLPRFVYEDDEKMERRPVMDYALESEHPRRKCGSSLDNTVSSYSTRCIA